MSKTKFAAIGGPGRSTLHTLGRRGYAPQPETLDKIDNFLLWEPGSAETVLKGGLPIRRGPTPTPHPALGGWCFAWQTIFHHQRSRFPGE